MVKGGGGGEVKEARRGEQARKQRGQEVKFR